jgi:hypothetical protein
VTIVPATPTAAVSTATAITPLLLTPRASVASGATSPSGTVGTASTPMVYTDPQGRFSFTVPDGYHQIPNATPAIVVEFAPPIVSGAISMTIQGMEPDATLEQKTEVTQKAAGKFPDYTPLTALPVPTTVAGQMARQFEFLDTENGGRRYHSFAVTTVRGTDFYTLSIEIEEKDFATNVEQAKVFINTFAFLGSG